MREFMHESLVLRGDASNHFVLGDTWTRRAHLLHEKSVVLNKNMWVEELALVGAK